jgi:hypothetical protein
MHKYDFTAIKLKRKQQRDVAREQKLHSYGISMAPLPLDDTTRATRIKLLAYENTKRSKGLTDHDIALNRLKQRTRNTAKGDARTARQYIQRKIINIRSRCKQAGIPCDISADDFTMPEVCPVLGIKLTWGSELVDGTPSFDRFNPAGGYVKGNVAIISLKANRLKNDGSIDDLKAVVAWMEATKP